MEKKIVNVTLLHWILTKECSLRTKKLKIIEEELALGLKAVSVSDNGTIVS